MEEDFEIIDSFIEDPPSHDVIHESLWYLGRSLQFLADADIAYFSQGWDQARGCIIENMVAQRYGIEFVTYGKYLDEKGIVDD